jgi:D-3-phosphoglycerate dehydrogenase
MKSLEDIRILIGPSSFAELDLAPLKRLEEVGFEIVSNPFGRKLVESELMDLLVGVSGIIAGLEPLNSAVLKNSELRVISRCGSGMSNVDLDAAKELGISVFSTPTAPSSAVAEVTLGALLSLVRMIPLMNRDLHEGKWNKRIGIQLEGKNVVIVGYGRIGRRFAELLAPFRTRLLVVDPAVDRTKIEPAILLPLEEALAQADIISLHASCENKIIGRDELNCLKPGAFLLNAARGNLIDEDALVEALEDRRVQGAWIDTFEEEPYSGQLRRFDQVILTPHIGSYSVECRRSMEMESVQNLIDGFKRT